MFLGLRPDATPEEFLACIADFSGDNHNTELSQAFRVRPGPGWNIPPGVPHAAGSRCTYEVGQASDTYAMCESFADDQPVLDDLRWKDVPAEHRGNHQYIVDMLDWQANTDPATQRTLHNPPLPITPPRHDGLSERWIADSSTRFSAKEVTIAPTVTAALTDQAAYGAIAVQGRGRFGTHPVTAPTLIRYEHPTQDEHFVSENAATAGVPITNHSATEPLALLQARPTPACPCPESLSSDPRRPREGRAQRRSVRALGVRRRGAGGGSKTGSEPPEPRRSTPVPSPEGHGSSWRTRVSAAQCSQRVGVQPRA
ncbi:hypothetical protein U9R90_18815 [Streptomyces sp. E11-3]|uniref:hypothetical protein n=1 Tax=Streptomyces sp. E11-3 TaxID=3110112 RepID=UPI003980161C